MSDEYSKHGAYEHKTGAAGGLVERDRTKHLTDRSKRNAEQVIKKYEDTSTAPSQEGKGAEYVPHSPTVPQGQFETTIITESSRNDSVVTESEVEKGSLDVSSIAQTTDVTIIKSDLVEFSDIPSDVPVRKASYLSQSYSFQQKPTQQETTPPVALAKDSRYFYEKPADSSSASVRYSSAVKTEVRGTPSDIEEQFTSKGISVIDITSPVVDGVRNQDDTGSELVSESYEIGTSVYRTTKKSPQKKTSAPQKAPAAQGANQAAAQEGGKKAGATISKAIPPIVWLWIFIGVAVSVLLFMFFGLSSMAVTEVAFGMGENTELVFSNPDTKNNLDIVTWCQWAVDNGHGYVYGAFGQLCTEEYLDQQAARYPGEDEAGGAMRLAGEQWIGKNVYDCIGIIKAYMWFDPEKEYISYASNDFPDCGANSIWDEVKVGESGIIGTIPETPGVAVWMNGHIGIYIGDGEVIEAQGTETGVVKTKLEDGSWTHWLYIPHLEYIEPPTEPTTMPPTESE